MRHPFTYSIRTCWLNDFYWAEFDEAMSQVIGDSHVGVCASPAERVDLNAVDIARLH
jgi:hypothetical protein